MATCYWAYPASAGSALSSPWSNSMPSYGYGSRSTTLVTLVNGDTSLMAVGMTVTSAVSNTATSQGTVTAIVSSTQFRTSISGTLAAGTTFCVRTPATSAPTLNDDVIIPYISNYATSATMAANQQFACKSYTCDPIDISGTGTGTWTLSGNSNAFMNIYGAVYLGSKVRPGATNYIIMRPQLSNNNQPFYQDPSCGLIPNMGINGEAGAEFYLTSALRMTTATSQLSVNRGGMNLNGNTATCGYITSNGAVGTGPGYININGGSITTTTTTSTVSAVQSVNSLLYTTNGAITVNDVNRSVATIDIGSTTPPSAGSPRCSFIWKNTRPNQILGGFYADSLDMSGVVGTITATTLRVKTLSMPTNGLSGSTVNFDMSGGTLTYGGGTMPNVTINHTGTTTTTNTIGSDASPVPTFTLTSGRLALAASTTLYASTIAGSGTTARGLDFGSGSVLSGGSAVGSFNFDDVTNFTSTGTFNIQGGTVAKAISFGQTVPTSSTYWPNYTSRVAGDTLFGDFKNIDTAGFAVGSSFARTIRLKSIINTNSANWANVTLKFSGTGPYSSTNSNQFADIQTDTLPATITFSAGSTITLTDFTLAGTAGNLVTINSSVSGTQFILSKSSGTVTSSYLAIQDSNATGGATWDASNGTNTNLGNNTGWIFAPAPTYTVNGQFFVFF